MRAANVRSGFTILELLIVISIVGLLLALTMPAVMDAREAARRATCQNNLRQIGVGLHNFEQTYRDFPGAFCGRVDLPGKYQGCWCLSPAAQMTDFLGDVPRAEAIVQDPNVLDPDFKDLLLKAPAVLCCSSDGLAFGRASSYRFCRGLLPLWPDDPGGVFTSFRGRAPKEITDGLAHTAFVSERLIATERGSDRLRDPLELPRLLSDEVAIRCLEANQMGGLGMPPSALVGRSPLGAVWLSGEWAHCSYYHLFPPNGSWRDCETVDSMRTTLASARSYHHGGVNVLFGDGRCVFVSNYVDLEVWQAYATRAGGEPVPL